MAFYQIKDHDEDTPPQVMAEFAVGEEEIEREWLDWIDQNGCEPIGGGWKGASGERVYSAWMFDPDVFFAYRMRWSVPGDREDR